MLGKRTGHLVLRSISLARALRMLISPVALLIEEVEEGVRYWRSRVEFVLDKLRSRGWRDQSPLELAAGVASSEEEIKESRDEEASAASQSLQSSCLVPKSRSQNLARDGTLLAQEDSSSDREYVDLESSLSEEDPASGVASALIDISRKRRVPSSRERNKPKRSKAGGGASDTGVP
ncbi:hypothetical protein AC1031_021680 [Aphanomyces cochlioides]|nr:hypothetical protein AC1031_021680 [Aphanomyces cochlioides]